jgi:hypothetical protein
VRPLLALVLLQLEFVTEAALLLGLSGNAVRKRLERGTLRSEKVDGVRYVLLDTDMSQHATRHATRHVRRHSLNTSTLRFSDIEKRDEEIRRKDHLLAAALERIPAIEEAPVEPREAPDTVTNLHPTF